MKPNSPEQLARLLDQLSPSYPNGIPRGVIKAAAKAKDAEAFEADVPRFHIFIAGEEHSTSDGARDLLSGITSKGLKIGPTEYLLTYTEDEGVENAALSSASPHVIVFGARRGSGWSERSNGSPVLFTSSLEALVGDPALKKALWKDLQALL